MQTDRDAIEKEEKVVEENEKKKVRSFGNKAFDWIVWPAILWIGVWGVSLYLANKAQNGAGILNKWYSGAQKWLTPKFGKFADSKTTKKIWGGSKEEWASATVLIGALSAGGTLFVPIIKFFEDRRQKIAAWLDRAFGKTSEHPELIKEEPKQTWGSMIKGRITVIATAYSIFAVFGPKRIGKVQDAVGGFATDMFIKIKPGADKTKARKWANLAVFDLFFTAMAATIHYITSRVIAVRKTEKAKIGLADAVIAENATAENKAQPAGDVEQRNGAEQNNGQDTGNTRQQPPAEGKKAPQSWMSGVDVTPMDIKPQQPSYTLH